MAAYRPGLFQNLYNMNVRIHACIKLNVLHTRNWLSVSNYGFISATLSVMRTLGPQTDFDLKCPGISGD